MEVSISCRSPPNPNKFRLFSSRNPVITSAFPVSSRPRIGALSFVSSPMIGRFRSLHPVSARRHEYDVVVIGAGIIGLTVARRFLLCSDLSVAVIDGRVPCFGATGAGQGYIWMSHKTPGSDIWELSMRSKQLWEELAEDIARQGMDPLQLLGWKKTGSLLIGRNLEDMEMLEDRVEMLYAAGLRAEYLSATALSSKEPALDDERDYVAAFFPDDCQLDALRTVLFIEKGNKSFSSEGRYAEFFNDPAIRLLRSNRNGEVEAVQTSQNILYGKRAVVVAAGAWSGSLMQNLVDILHAIPVKPRKGHLLVVENFNEIQLNHGVMEMGYIDHIVATQLSKSASSTEQENLPSISMTATTDMLGNLVLGSSRQFTGFNTEVNDHVSRRIWERAGEFFPALREKPLDLSQKKTIRVGLRPYMPDGKPIIGPVPGLPKLLLATGHEGSGLCMALATAEMVVDMVLGNTMKVDSIPFSIQGRQHR